LSPALTCKYSFKNTVFIDSETFSSGYVSLLFYGGETFDADIVYIPPAEFLPSKFNISFRVVNAWENTVTPSRFLSASVDGVPLGGDSNSSYVSVGDYSEDWQLFYTGPTYLISIFDQDLVFLGQTVASGLMAGIPYDIYVLPTLFSSSSPPAPYPTIRVVAQTDASPP